MNARHWIPTLLIVLLGAACVDEFPLGPDRQVLIEQPSEAPWPNSLFVQDEDTLEIRITDSAEDQITGVQVEWQSSDPQILEVVALQPDSGDFRDTLTFQLRAVAKAHKRGTVQVMVTVDRPGFTPITQGDSVTVEEHWVSIAAGFNHTCGVTIDGDLYCWGNGLLGDGSAAGSLVPVEVRGDQKFSSVTAGSGHSCAVAVDGTVFCWGANTFGAIGNGSSPGQSQLSPVPISLGRTFTSVSAGVNYVCGVTSDEKGFCWGTNLNLQLGDAGVGATNMPDPPFFNCGTGLDTILCSLTPRPVQFTDTSGAEPIKIPLDLLAVAAGSKHSCGIRLTDSTAVCWGTGKALGNVAAEEASATPVAVTGSERFEAVTNGFEHTCAISTSKQAYCWGLNSDGQLGIHRAIELQEQCTNDPECAGQPLLVAGGKKYQALSANASTSCGITTGAELYCWGLSPPPTQNSRAEPVQVEIPGGAPIVALSVGPAHVCVVAAAGAAYCWGAGSGGQLGNDETNSYATPQRVHEPR